MPATATKTTKTTKATATNGKAPTKRVAKTVAAPKRNLGGRPRSYDEERRQIQIRLPEDLRERLDDEASRRRVSKNYLIEQMISDMLPTYEGQALSV
jgi:hypothetical protein